MRTPEYERLLDMLTAHPEFSSIEDNPCDKEIIAYGSSLWKKWAKAERAELSSAQVGTSVDAIMNSHNVTERTKDIVQMVIDGVSSIEIKSKHGLTATQLADIKQRYRLNTVAGVRDGRIKHELDPEVVRKDLQRLNSMKELALEYQMPLRSLQDFIKRNGITGWKRKKSESFTLKDIAVAQRTGVSMIGTAMELDISGATLASALKFLGVTWQEVLDYAA